MQQQAAATKRDDPVDDFVRKTIEQYRAKLLDLSSRNPLVNFRHSDRSRSHVRIVDEIPEKLYDKLAAGQRLTFDPVPEPELMPADESLPPFELAVQKAKRENEDYRKAVAELRPNASDRQRQKIERELRNWVRVRLGLQPYEPVTDAKKRAAELGIATDYDLPTNTGQSTRRYHNLRIQTLWYREDLNRKLGGLRDAARVLLQDAGLSALYCALGFLEYYESDSSDEKRIAPLVFFPVDLDRELQAGAYRYFIQSRNEDVEINVALAELLRQQFSLAMPQWAEPEDGGNAVESYFQEFERAIAGRRDWKLRRFATVGLFTFSTLAMYKDLDPQRWTNTPLEERELIRTLIAGKEVHGTNYAADYDIDAQSGPEPLLITEADSSQHSAVIDVLNGKSGVVQGPPGTGKSQTITNMISAAMHAGKTVLFVAEKMAALDVVKKRLDGAGLAPFCFELHSSKTSKSLVASSLSARLEHQGPRINLVTIQSNLEALQHARKELIYYVEKANSPAGTTGLKVCDVLLGSAKRESDRKLLPAGILNARFANALKLSQHVRKQMLDMAGNLQKRTVEATKHSKLANHAWRGLRNSEITDFEVDGLLAMIRAWADSADDVCLAAQRICNGFGVVISLKTRDLRHLCDVVANVPEPDDNIIPNVFETLSSAGGRGRLKAVIDDVRLLRDIDVTLYPEYTRDLQSLIRVGSAFVEGLTDSATQAGLPEHEHIGDLADQLKAYSLKVEAIAEAERVAALLGEAVGLKAETIAGRGATVAAAECVYELPHELWKLRVPEVLDLDSFVVLQRAATQCQALRNNEERISRQLDLALLPPASELRELGIALKTANFITAAFTRKCRLANWVFRGASRDESKRSRSEVAALLLQTADYLDEKTRFENNAEIKHACGRFFAGLETPFTHLLELQRWASDVHRVAAQHPDFNRSITELMFGASVEQFEAIINCRNNRGYATLLAVVNEFASDESISLTELRFRESARCSCVTDLIAGAEAAQLQPSVEMASLAKVAKLLRTSEMKSKALESDGGVCGLIGGSAESAKRDEARLSATATYASVIAALPLQPAIIQSLLKSTANVVRFREEGKKLSDRLVDLEQKTAAAVQLGKIDPKLWCGVQLQDASVDALASRCRLALDHGDELQDYLGFLLAEERVLSAGLGPVLRAYSSVDEDYHDLPTATELVFYRSAAEQILSFDPQLKRHSGSSHELLRTQYQQLDREYLDLRRKQLAAMLLQRSVPEGNRVGKVADLTELALVQLIAGQTRPRIALRELFRRSGNAIKAIKPCWLMSPMSVAKFLEPNGIEFDLVVMDEASQIRPEEALGAAARGKQIVVVGDQMQLPPTPFFQKLSAEGTGEGDEEELEDVQQDSILEAAASRFYPSRRLKWHYRSEHGSLISFSNKEFYNDDLVVFPSPFHRHLDYGLKLVTVDGVYGGGVNLPEVKTVGEHACEFMKNNPNRSLGIVAVNSKQADLIREEIDRLCAEDPRAEAYRSKWANEIESLFVKNLENVQGDERDVIFISTVYGKDESGNFYQRFGPINSAYGHRRLNVLFTRAKKQVVIFTSLDPNAIQEEGKNRGVRALKGYLQYARDGHSVLPTGSAGECESEFEEWVLQMLQASGYEGVPQLGYSGYRIDIAVRDPNHPGTFLCGIECDGATYHSAKSVRERDRLRQEVLERLGWNIYRIWSTDWFRNPTLQTKQLITHLQRLHSRGSGSEQPPPPSDYAGMVKRGEKLPVGFFDEHPELKKYASPEQIKTTQKPE